MLVRLTPRAVKAGVLEDSAGQRGSARPCRLPAAPWRGPDWTGQRHLLR